MKKKNLYNIHDYGYKKIYKTAIMVPGVFKKIFIKATTLNFFLWNRWP